MASSWVPLGSFAIAAGVVIVASSNPLPRWLGRWAIVAGAGLVAARPLWTTDLWYLPYFLGAC